MWKEKNGGNLNIMKFMYQYPRLPQDPYILLGINSAACRLFNKLKHLDIFSLDISDYNKRYLNDYNKDMVSKLRLFSYILSWSVAFSDVQLSEFVFIDYGGGSGLLSLLSKEFNIGTVIYNDIYDVSCKDAEVIGESLNIKADYYVHGDFDDVIKFLKKNSIVCNAISSNDVIEHIYDVKGFLKKLNKLSDNSMNLVMATSANIFNPLITRSYMKKQIKEEYTDRNYEWGHKERDTLKAYYKIRKEIIQKYAKHLNNNEVEHLSKATRGLIEYDIKKCVDKYLKTGQFPKEPNHPTNTCDPYTGNWSEHLMDPYQLKKILSKTGFEVKILNGYYGSYKNIILKLLSTFLNLVINISRKQGIRIAPFIILYGTKTH